jgi:hypothetical protein
MFVIPRIERRLSRAINGGCGGGVAVVRKTNNAAKPKLTIARNVRPRTNFSRRSARLSSGTGRRRQSIMEILGIVPS